MRRGPGAAQLGPSRGTGQNRLESRDSPVLDVSPTTSSNSGDKAGSVWVHDDECSSTRAGLSSLPEDGVVEAALPRARFFSTAGTGVGHPINGYVPV